MMKRSLYVDMGYMGGRFPKHRKCSSIFHTGFKTCQSNLIKHALFWMDMARLWLQILSFLGKNCIFIQQKMF